MNGSANGFAGALFFSLVSIGIIFAVEGVVGWVIGAVSAMFAAVNLRRALIQAAEAAEEDHQRIEIQFQQLRHKVGESSASNTLAMNSISEISDTMQETLHGMRSKLAALDNLETIAETNSAMGAVLKNIEDNTKTKPSSDNSFNKLGEKFEKNFVVLKKLSEDTEKICTLEETNKAALQATVKLLQALGQILKTPSFAKDLEKISEKINLMDEMQKTLSESHTAITALVKISADMSKNNSKLENFGEVSEKIVSSAENLTEMFADVKKEISELTKKIEAYNGLTKATLDQYSNLTEQDVRILEKIAEKVNGN